MTNLDSVLKNKDITLPTKVHIVKAMVFPLVMIVVRAGSLRRQSTQAWCTGKTQRNRVEREVGGGFGMGNTCNSMADSCQCMTKPTAML